MNNAGSNLRRPQTTEATELQFEKDHDDGIVGCLLYSSSPDLYSWAASSGKDGSRSSLVWWQRKRRGRTALTYLHKAGQQDRS